MVNTSGGLFRYAVAALELLWVLCVNEGGKIATVIEDEVEALAALEGSQLLLQAPVVLFFGLAFPGKTVAMLGAVSA
jgi:hypothetical protein